MSALIIEPLAGEGSTRLAFPEELRWDDDALLTFCEANRAFHIERDAEGAIIIMHPDGLPSSPIDMELSLEVGNWARQYGGQAFNAAAGFSLPSTAMRAPDVAWISDRQWMEVRGTKGFVRACPEFLIEVRSASDRLPTLRKKMLEWLENGARLAWLVDPEPRRVEVWRPGRDPEIHSHPLELSAEPECPGLVVNFRRAWEKLMPPPRTDA